MNEILFITISKNDFHNNHNFSLLPHNHPFIIFNNPLCGEVHCVVIQNNNSRLHVKQVLRRQRHVSGKDVACFRR